MHGTDPLFLKRRASEMERSVKAGQELADFISRRVDVQLAEERTRKANSGRLAEVLDPPTG